MPSNVNTVIDIFMPTFKPDLNLLERAIKSIKNQSFQLWKLYIVENGAKTIPDDFIQKFNDARISYRHLEIKGKPNALNFALSISDSEFIAYLDDDDTWFQNHLSDSISALQSRNISFLYTDAHEVVIERDGNLLKEVERRNMSRGIITEKTLWYISHINVVHTRELIRASGSYDENRTYFIDWDILQRMAQIEKPYHLPIYTCEHYIYLDRSLNKTNTISSQHLKDPGKSKRLHEEMFKRAFSLLTPDDFLDLIKDIQDKTRQIETLSKTDDRNSHPLLQTISKLEEDLHDIKASYSWQITKPFRSILDFTRRLASR